MLVPESFRTSYGARYHNDTQISFAYNAYAFAKQTTALFGKRPIPTQAEEVMALFSKNSKSGEFLYREDEKSGKYFAFKLGLKQVADGKFFELLQ